MLRPHKKKKLFRGFTDTLYLINLASVHIINLIIVLLTIFQSQLNIVDLSAVSNLPQWAYAELAIHTGFVIWKAKCENMQKFGKQDDITML